MVDNGFESLEALKSYLETHTTLNEFVRDTWQKPVYVDIGLSEEEKQPSFPVIVLVGGPEQYENINLNGRRSRIYQTVLVFYSIEESNSTEQERLMSLYGKAIKDALEDDPTLNQMVTWTDVENMDIDEDNRGETVSTRSLNLTITIN